MEHSRVIQQINCEHLQSDWLSQHRFTDRAVLMLRQAIQRGDARGLFDFMPASLVLWTILRWEQMLATMILEESGVDIAKPEDDVDGRLRARECNSTPKVVDCSEIDRLAMQAVEESKQLNIDFVDSEQLLLALFDIDPDHLRETRASHSVDKARYSRTLRRIYADAGITARVESTPE